MPMNLETRDFEVMSICVDLLFALQVHCSPVCGHCLPSDLPAGAHTGAEEGEQHQDRLLGAAYPDHHHGLGQPVLHPH